MNADADLAAANAHADTDEGVLHRLLAADATGADRSLLASTGT